MTSGPHPARATPLGNSRRKVASAKKHILNFERAEGRFLTAHPYGVVVEPDSKEPNHWVYKLRFNRTLPDSLADHTSIAVSHLRSALDNAIYELAISAGVANPRRAAFPFSDSALKFENAMKGRSKDVPEEIHALFRAYKPYRGGNDFLWALNEVSNTDKHKLLTIAAGVQLGDVVMEGGALVGGLPINPTWDSLKHEIKLATFVSSHAVKYQADYALFIAFDEIPVVGGKPVFGVLDQFASIVEGILAGLEAEARRLGFVR